MESIYSLPITKGQTPVSRHDALAAYRFRLPDVSRQVIGQTVAPFLREHIQGLYAPVGKPDPLSMRNVENPNSKCCYRHRPDSKCRRAADESKMALIQSELESLPAGDRQAITNVWSLFSAAPTKHRELMLRGIITQCCFPQLSVVSREVQEQLKIDFLSALPSELSLKILCHLDCASLCKAAQVSRRWNTLSGDDVVWHRMCEQHIGRKCEKCQWGLPKLEKRRLQEWKIQRQMDMNNTRRALIPSLTPAVNNHGLPTSAPAKRGADSVNADDHQEKKVRLWKEVYRDRYYISSNWKYGRCAIKTFTGQHTNGVTCLQFDDNMLATGSYDSTIKLWNIETGEVIRTLRGHTSGIRALQFDDRILVSGSLDGDLRVWNWRTGRCINTLHHQDGVITVHMAGGLVASGSIDKTIKVFNFETQQSFCLRGHLDWVNQVRLDLASRTLLSASDDCTVKLWDLDSQTCIKTYEGHAGQVQQVLLLPDDLKFEDEHMREADAASVISQRSGAPSVASSSSYLAAQHNDTRAAYGPIFINNPERQLPPRYFLTGSLDLTMRLWDSASGQSPRCFWGHVEGIWGLAGDALRFVTGANDATVKVWDPRTVRCEHTFTGHNGPVTCVGLSDSRMASGGEDGEVRLYSFEGAPSEFEEVGAGI
ncbi:sulfur controller 2 [Daldinia caldariorum]|uniref:sulfur controller 2 n=1 Tax=Daldinia caldariorum TaxID=326644 RepID=UPI0020075C47|nr:sulfur controller 2 [Daldinia caldariorum]KAI1464523.1 sulfur controller 2 [Daldinia caldariorum]